MRYRNKTTDDEFHIPFREEKSFLIIIMNLFSLWKLKKIEIFLTKWIKSSTPFSEGLELKLLQKV